MRALHVIPAVAPRYGGPSTAIAPMCRALAACGVEPFIVTTDADGPGRLDVPVAEPTTWQGVPAIFFKRDFSESYKYSRGLARWMRAHVREFDVVHIHAVFSHACLAAAAACRREKVPYVVRPLGTLAPWSLQQKPVRKRLMLMMGATRMMKGAAAIHCTSAQEQQGIEELFHTATSVVLPLGIDAAWLVPSAVDASERDRDPYVLVVSRLHEKKNLEALIESFIEVNAGRGRSAWRLLIAGSGEADYVARLETLIRSRGADDRVRLIGWVEGEAKRDLVSHASAFAQVSLHENFGVSLLEALATGVPAIVSRQVDLADAVAEANAGWIVDTDRQAVRAGLLNALDNEADRKSRGDAARRLARRFAWPVVSQEMANLYTRMLGTLHP